MLKTNVSVNHALAMLPINSALLEKQLYSVMSHLIHKPRELLYFVLFTDIMEEELFAQFNKIANSILHSKSKEQRTGGEDSLSDTNTKQIPKNGCEGTAICCKAIGGSLENVSPAMKIKALQVHKDFLNSILLFVFKFPSPSPPPELKKQVSNKAYSAL